MDTNTTPVEASTPAAPVVTSTPGASTGVNPAQATAQSIVDTSALIAQYEQRIRNLMSEKDKSINERNQAIAQLTELQRQYTTAQEQTQSSLSAAANSAQQAIDRTTHLERELTAQQARNAKLAALMQRPHLVAYESLIPEHGDEAKLKEVLDQLEQIRAQDLKQYAPTQQPPSVQQQASSLSPMQQQASTLQSLYGNRATMNPAFQTPQVPLPASSPAQMNPAASTDVVSAINQLYAEARKAGTPEAFEDATRRASLLASQAPR